MLDDIFVVKQQTNRRILNRFDRKEGEVLKSGEMFLLIVTSKIKQRIERMRRAFFAQIAIPKMPLDRIAKIV